MATKDESLLLALPLELLTRITDSLHDESLSTLRLTCKTLERTTFDRFAKTFKTSHCCIFYEDLWLSLERFLKGAPRLVAKVSQIQFTTDLLERDHWSDAQIAPGPQFDDIEDAQREIYSNDDYEEEDDEDDDPEHRLLLGGHPPSAELVTRVLFDVEELAPHAMVGFDFLSNRKVRNMGIKVHEDVLSAIATTQICFEQLHLSHHYTNGIKELPARVRSDFLSCLSTLFIFSYEGDYPWETENESQDEVEEEREEERLQIVEDVIQRARNIGVFSLDLEKFEWLPSPWIIAERLLLACRLASVANLRLKDVVISEKQFAQAISCCTTQLEHLNLYEVEMREIEHGWPAVFRPLSNLRLRSMVFFNLKVQDSPRLDFTQMKHGRKLGVKDPYFGYAKSGDNPSLGMGVRFERREEVAAGLQELLI